MLPLWMTEAVKGTLRASAALRFSLSLRSTLDCLSGVLWQVRSPTAAAARGLDGH